MPAKEETHRYAITEKDKSKIMTQQQFDKAQEYRDELQRIDMYEGTINDKAPAGTYMSAFENISPGDYYKFCDAMKKRVKSIIAKRKSAIKIAISEL
jgi:hypothetical protein